MRRGHPYSFRAHLAFVFAHRPMTIRAVQTPSHPLATTERGRVPLWWCRAGGAGGCGYPFDTWGLRGLHSPPWPPSAGKPDAAKIHPSDNISMIQAVGCVVWPVQGAGSRGGVAVSLARAAGGVVSGKPLSEIKITSAVDIVVVVKNITAVPALIRYLWSCGSSPHLHPKGAGSAGSPPGLVRMGYV